MKIIRRIKCLFGDHTWFYGQSGMLRYLYCIHCYREIFPEGEEQK